eukprot:m.54624 g.54624  ORF g.54624 m.54624 type:complete len:246 (+) comp48774_c0_seq1:129-866(+)
MLEFVVFLAGFLGARQVAETAGGVTVQLFKTGWFVLAVAIECYLLTDRPWVPTFMGGPQTVSLSESTWEDDITSFYFLQMAYHWHSLIYSWLKPVKAEMYLHHVVTVILIGLSHYVGYQRVGLLIYYVHDVPDIVGNIMKTVTELEVKPALVPCWALLVVTWGYYRLNIFLRVIAIVMAFEHLAWPFALLLLTLWCLHVYWFVLFFKIFVKYVTKGRLHDSSERISRGKLTSTLDEDESSHQKTQ